MQWTAVSAAHSRSEIASQPGEYDRRGRDHRDARHASDPDEGDHPADLRRGYLGSDHFAVGLRLLAIAPRDADAVRAVPDRFRNSPEQEQFFVRGVGGDEEPQAAA